MQQKTYTNRILITICTYVLTSCLHQPHGGPAARQSPHVFCSKQRFLISSAINSIRYMSYVRMYVHIPNIIYTYINTGIMRTPVEHKARICLRSADAYALTVPRTNTRLRDRSFSAAGPKVWNSLPATLRQPDVELGQFKRLLKTFLFGEAAAH